MAEIAISSFTEVPEQLYHTILHYVDAYTSGAPFTVCPLATHTDLSTAKEYARNALHDLGYQPDDFANFELRTAVTENWQHGDGTIVWAKAANGTEVMVNIDTTSNDEKLPEGLNHQLQLPNGSSHLHYVVQTTIDLVKDRSGIAQQSEVEGVYARRSDAILAAKRQLAELSDNNDFAQYEERNDLGGCEEWPYGEDVVVHAIAQTGDNFYIAVKTVPGAHRRHNMHRTRILASNGYKRSTMAGEEKAPQAQGKRDNGEGAA
ncbi:hypothetical protein BKA67DRAFT_591121 [Truncatella angustata]|uniref:Uncharacterized protein n=1 Tax=Truncatella angustata TaxID=152316 RepID=A0A9P8UTQ8_9PEZI|nr:uncharacterized protein BKA67DRAFT_591121 [Truncatella angustata]KAH6657907.1 hypothetical protein BKA67DRAFT_591121 [Truncatella angustata]KAH8197753.1 hypothetical protein TruAng_008087 [Truncatella angustata]